MEKDNRIAKILKRILAIFGISTTLVLPTTVIADMQQKDKTMQLESKQSFKDEIKIDTPTVTSELNKIINNSKELTYDELIEKFNEEMNKKNFTGLSYEFLKRFIDDVYINYDSWKALYPDLPNKDIYILEHIIEVIKEVKSISCYECNSKEGIKLLSENSSRYGFTDSELNITVLYDSNLQNNDTVAKRLGHELAHVYQSSILLNDEYFGLYKFIKPYILEGDATQSMKYALPIELEKEIADIFPCGDYCIKYKMPNSLEGYPVNMNIYLNLQYLLGYNVMNNLINGKMDILEIKKIVEEKYGNETANIIFENLQILYDNDFEDDKKRYTEALINIQKTFFGCIEQDIREIKTEMEYNNYNKKYNLYRQFMPTIEQEGKDATNEFFDIEKINDLLQEQYSK